MGKKREWKDMDHRSESEPGTVDDTAKESQHSASAPSDEPDDTRAITSLLQSSHDDEEDEHAQDKNAIRKKKAPHRLSLTKTEDFNAKLQKRGVLYIARVPPRMNPTKVKSLLSDFGSVTRVYLVEEDTARRKRRKKMGGGGGKRYTEGWVEFENKKVAKHVAQNLNNTPISMQKRNVHFGDLWNIKYLPKFKWAHLTEKVAYERRVREQKLRMDMMQARRENASYTQLVETGKKLDKIEERKRKRMEKMGVTFEAGDEQKRRRRPRQTKPVEEGADGAAKRAVLGSLV